MPRLLAALALGTVLSTAVLLTGCANASPPTPTPSPTATVTGPSPQAAKFPRCNQISSVVARITDLPLDQSASDTVLGTKDYERRACVYTSADQKVQLAVVLTAVALAQSQLDRLASGATTIADPRVTAVGAVLQSAGKEGAAGSPLGSALLLYDPVYTILITAASVQTSTSTALPGLTVGAATDALLGIRALIR
ncbi:MAG: hypothetical protein ACYCZY_03695 [Lacisediminihabitans sp.]